MSLDKNNIIFMALLRKLWVKKTLLYAMISGCNFTKRYRSGGVFKKSAPSILSELPTLLKSSDNGP